MQGFGSRPVDSGDRGAGWHRIFLVLQNWQAFLRGGFISMRDLPESFRKRLAVPHRVFDEHLRGGAATRGTRAASEGSDTCEGEESLTEEPVDGLDS